MNRSKLIVFIIAAAATLPGCFDSLVSAECQPGMVMVGGECRTTGDDPPDAGDGGPDAGDPDRPDAPDIGGPDAATGDGGDDPDAQTCPGEEVVCDGECVDLQTDPHNCGACNHVCASGLCVEGACVGDIAGHVVVIGHDYLTHNQAMSRVIGNAAALAPADPIRVARYRGTASDQSVNGTTNAMSQGLTAIGRGWTQVSIGEDPMGALAVADVFLIHAQRGDGDALATLGASWQAPIAAFIARGGVVVVVEGALGTSHRLISGTGVVSIDSVSPATGSAVSVVAFTDAVGIAVPIPYYASGSSAWFQTTSTDHVIRDPDGHPVVLHVGQ